MKVAAIEYPLPEDLQNCTALSHNEVWDKVWDKLSNHYGVDVRNIALLYTTTITKIRTKHKAHKL